MAREKRNESEPVDVLAAEEFAVPAPDPALKPEHLELPPDPVTDKPHDVLAAEAFPMPSPEEAHRAPTARPRRQAALRIGLNLLPLMMLWFLRRARRRYRAAAFEDPE